jgi:methionine aminopeptidase
LTLRVLFCCAAAVLLLHVCSDLGCHIDGFIATQAQTVLVAASFDTPITGQAADLVEAARTAFNAAIRLIKPGEAIRLHCGAWFRW